MNTAQKLDWIGLGLLFKGTFLEPCSPEWIQTDPKLDLLKSKSSFVTLDPFGSILTGEEVLPRNLGGGVLPAFGNPYPIGRSRNFGKTEH